MVRRHHARGAGPAAVVGIAAPLSRAARLAARLDASAVPLLPDAAELAAAGFVSGGTRANTDRMRDVVTLDDAIPAEVAVLLHDAQTSGGLLLAVAPAQAPALASVLRVQGLPAALIGEVVAGESGRVEVSHAPFGINLNYGGMRGGGSGSH